MKATKLKIHRDKKRHLLDFAAQCAAEYERDRMKREKQAAENRQAHEEQIAMSAEHLKRAEALLLAAQYQATRELLELLVNSASDREAGRKALLVAFILDRKLIGTQKQLAKKMGVSEARASQMLKSIRANFPYKISRLVDSV